MTASFHVEQVQSEQQCGDLLRDVLPCFADAWQRGPHSARPFQPDMQMWVMKAMMGVERWITARNGREVVAFQKWIFAPSDESAGLTVAMCIGIWKKTPDACDTARFIQFGVAAMKAAGAQQVGLLARLGTNLVETMTMAGCKPVEMIMEA